MKFGYTLIYVPQVAETLAFYEAAFGLSRRFLHESGDYGELETGETTLAFAALTLAEGHLGPDFQPLRPEGPPVGMEIALVTHDVDAAYARAVAAGASPLRAPEAKPWGQTVAWVHSREGTLIELCTPVSH